MIGPSQVYAQLATGLTKLGEKFQDPLPTNKGLESDRSGSCWVAISLDWSQGGGDLAETRRIRLKFYRI